MLLCVVCCVLCLGVVCLCVLVCVLVTMIRQWGGGTRGIPALLMKFVFLHQDSFYFWRCDT